ncbi:MAG: diguanylate cyclase [Gammaproteobacteria bacterium]|nr:diguanylate cyclase [Gammaproteobacteria bacterium]
MAVSELLTMTGANNAEAPLVAPAVLDNVLISQVVDAVQDGVSISDMQQPDMPLVFVNGAFESITGYKSEDILGKNCRVLQGDDRSQPEIDKLRRAFARGTDCVATLRNYRRDGTLFYNELRVIPVHDTEGALTHYIGIQKDVTSQVRLQQQLLERERKVQRLNAQLELMARCDELTDLINRRTFDDCLDREWRRAARDGAYLTLYMIDIDRFKAVNEKYGHAIGDACLQSVARVLEDNFRRATDFVARYGGEEFVILDAGRDPDQASVYGERLLAAMHACQLPTPEDKLTISIGMSTMQPGPDIAVNDLLTATEAALRAAKDAGRDRMMVAPPADQHNS